MNLKMKEYDELKKDLTKDVDSSKVNYKQLSVFKK